MTGKKKTVESVSSPPLKPAVAIMGATGGIGQAITAACLKKGYSLYLQGLRRFHELMKLEDKVKAAGGNIEIYSQDFYYKDNQIKTVESIFKSVRQRGEHLQAWVNATGIDLMTGWPDSSTFEDKLRHILELDVIATSNISRDVGERLVRQQQQHPNSPTPLLLFFGWDGVDRGRAGDTSQLYAISKGAMIALSRCLAQSLAPLVRVNTISPGWIATTWGKKASPKSKAIGEHDSLTGRWGTPEEIAAVATFLISDEASFMNGQNIVVNGGFNYRNE